MIVEFGHPMIQLLNCLSVPIPGTLHFLLRHPFFGLFLVLIAPTGKWRSFIDNIAYCPEHALLVSFLGDVVIWADDVELIICNLLFHVGSHLLGRPCACRLLFGGSGNIARLEPVSLEKQGVTKIRPEYKNQYNASQKRSHDGVTEYDKLSIFTACEALFKQLCAPTPWLSAKEKGQSYQARERPSWDEQMHGHTLVVTEIPAEVFC